jgi:hypothetical protein
MRSGPPVYDSPCMTQAEIVLSMTVRHGAMLVPGKQLIASSAKWPPQSESFMKVSF